MPISTVRTVSYSRDGAAPGLLDVYRPEDAPGTTPAVLLWHGMAPDSRFELGALAEETASHGLTVFVPDWRSDAPDGGHAHLIASLRYVQEHAPGLGADPGRLVVAGWSAGAGAALATGLRPDLTDCPPPKAVVGIAGRYDRPARCTGAVLLDDPAGGTAAPAPRGASGTPESRAAAAPGVPVVLIHGTADAVVPSHHSRDLLAALGERRRSPALYEMDADHAGVVLTTYDPERGHCVPATGTGADAGAVRAGRETARLIAAAAFA
ncbi:alpha/beta hydrolase family protein [Streptomyces sp. NPDC048111]|uniref:alpha/beta hydrolase family protein n=1 Tax=Streptomyces sp. NPDC048111 TaxID=3365500 RepID=UPI003715A0B0